MVNYRFVYLNTGVSNFPKSSSYLKIYCTRRVTWSKFHTEDTQILGTTVKNSGTPVAQWLRCCATNRKIADSIPAGVSGIFHWCKVLPIVLWSWGRLILQRKWVPGAFPGGKGGRCVRLTTLPPSCAVVMKSGNLNFLGPTGPLQACNGTALLVKIQSFRWPDAWDLCTAVLLLL